MGESLAMDPAQDQDFLVCRDYYTIHGVVDHVEGRVLSLLVKDPAPGP